MYVHNRLLPVQGHHMCLLVNMELDNCQNRPAVFQSIMRFKQVSIDKSKSTCLSTQASLILFLHGVKILTISIIFNFSFCLQSCPRIRVVSVPIHVRSGRFGLGRFGPISEASHFGPVGAGRFGPISLVGRFGSIFSVSRFCLIYLFEKTGKPLAEFLLTALIKLAKVTYLMVLILLKNSFVFGNSVFYKLNSISYVYFPSHR